MLNRQLKPDPYLTVVPPRLLVGSADEIMVYINRLWPDNGILISYTTAGLLIRRTEESTGYTYYYVCLIEDKTTRALANTVSILSHEICHLVFYVFKDRDIKAKAKNDEPFCYYQEWLLKQCVALLYRK